MIFKSSTGCFAPRMKNVYSVSVYNIAVHFCMSAESLNSACGIGYEFKSFYFFS